MSDNKLKSKSVDLLFESILKIENLEEAYTFLMT